MNRVLRILITIASSCFSAVSLACMPPATEIIPPDSPTGEFVYVPPLSKADRFRQRLEEVDDFAVVKVYADVHRTTYPANAQTEFRVLHGWGKPAAEVVKYIRPETSCGKPEKLEVGRWYVALIGSYETPWLMPYREVEDLVEIRGEPNYVYTPNGRLPR